MKNDKLFDWYVTECECMGWRRLNGMFCDSLFKSCCEYKYFLESVFVTSKRFLHIFLLLFFVEHLKIVFLTSILWVIFHLGFVGQ